MSNDSYSTLYNTTLLSNKSERVRERYNAIVERGKASLDDATSNVRKFGDHEDTQDWIECASKSFPGKTYFYNVRSCCSTWTRPVSKHVSLPRIQRRLMDNELTYHLQSELMIVSEDEEDCDIPPDVPNFMSSTGETNRRENRHRKSFPPLNYDAKMETGSTCTDQTVKSGSVWSFTENDDRAKVAAMHAAPVLRKIQPQDLLIKTSRRRKKTVTNKNGKILGKEEARRKLKPKKIVFIMNGTKTVSYDPIEPQLPSGIKMSNLSDTSVATTWREETNAPKFDNFYNLHDLGFKIGEPALSESSSVLSGTD